jgi:carbamoyltransferase
VPFSAWELPFNAIDYCLRQAGVTLRMWTTWPTATTRAASRPRRAEGATHQPAAGALGPGAGEWENVWDPLFAAYIVNAPRQLADGAPHHLRKRLAGVRADGALPLALRRPPPCHQASAFLASPFARCAVMTLDGRGEHATTTYGRYRDSRYRAAGRGA